MSTYEPTKRERVQAQELLDYFRADEDRPVAGSGPMHWIRDRVPAGWRPGLRTLATNLLYPWQQAAASQLVDRDPLQLNLGCGTLAMDDWVNVDLIGLPVDLMWDITRPLPFGNGTVDAIFHEHVLEHLAVEDGFHFLEDCHRLLRTGGILRIVAPDASLYINSYVDPEDDFLEEWRGVPYTPMMALQHEFYNFGHQAMYDAETVALFLEAVGFEHVETSEFGTSRLDPCPDSEWRQEDSLYVEAVK